MPGDEKMEWWRDGLTYRDWLFDGSPINGHIMIARFNNLDWSKAYLDMGPSVMGNPGPYWHVPLKETIIDGEVYDFGDTVHRLYPKVLTTKWLPVIRHACAEIAERNDPKNLRKQVRNLSLALAKARVSAKPLPRLAPR